MNKLLLVDDDEVDRELVSKSLRALNLEIVEVKSGSECLAALKAENFALIMLDYKLPDYDGLVLIGEIRRLVPNTPIVIVTGFGNDDLVKATSMAGVLDCIPKNRITPEFLTRTILNDLLIHKTQMEKAMAEAELEKHRKENVELLTAIIHMAKEKLAEYDAIDAK